MSNVDESAKIYGGALGIEDIEFETIDAEGVKVAILRLENARIELIQPIEKSGPIQKFLDTRGPGLHHMAIQTDDITQKVQDMKQQGVRFLGDIHAGSEGTQITFIHPKSLDGVLTELCYYPKHKN